MARTPAAASLAEAQQSGCREPATGQRAVPPRERLSECRRRTDKSGCRQQEAVSAHCPVGRSEPAAALRVLRVASPPVVWEPRSASRRQTMDAERRRLRVAGLECSPADRSARSAARGRKAVPPAESGPLSAYHRPRTGEERRQKQAVLPPVPSVLPGPEPSVPMPQAAAAQRGAQAAPDARRPAAYVAEPPRAERAVPDEQG